MTDNNHTATPATDEPPTEAESVIEAIGLLHSLCVPAADISRRLHVDQATTLHVLQTGRLPARQLTLAWVDEREVAS